MNEDDTFNALNRATFGELSSALEIANEKYHDEATFDEKLELDKWFSIAKAVLDECGWTDKEYIVANPKFVISRWHECEITKLVNPR